MAARLKKAAYGMNDAPRRWWNRLDKSLRQYGLVPTRADRCVYVMYGAAPRSTAIAVHKDKPKPIARTPSEELLPLSTMDESLEYLLDPVTGSPAHGKKVHGAVALHVDDLFFTGTPFSKQRF